MGYKVESLQRQGELYYFEDYETKNILDAEEYTTWVKRVNKNWPKFRSLQERTAEFQQKQWINNRIWGRNGHL